MNQVSVQNWRRIKCCLLETEANCTWSCHNCHGQNWIVDPLTMLFIICCGGVSVERCSPGFSTSDLWGFEVLVFFGSLTFAVLWGLTDLHWSDPQRWDSEPWLSAACPYVWQAWLGAVCFTLQTRRVYITFSHGQCSQEKYLKAIFSQPRCTGWLFNSKSSLRLVNKMLALFYDTSLSHFLTLIFLLNFKPNLKSVILS